MGVGQGWPLCNIDLKIVPSLGYSCSLRTRLAEIISRLVEGQWRQHYRIRHQIFRTVSADPVMVRALKQTLLDTLLFMWTAIAHKMHHYKRTAVYLILGVSEPIVLYTLTLKLFCKEQVIIQQLCCNCGIRQEVHFSNMYIVYFHGTLLRIKINLLNFHKTLEWHLLYILNDKIFC